VQKDREAANRAKCQNNLRQMVLAALNYESAHGVYPPGAGPSALYAINAPADAQPAEPGVGRPPAVQRPSTQVMILPYVEQAAKYNQFDLTRDVLEDDKNATARKSDVSIFLCPSDPGGATFTRASDGGPSGRCNYLANMGRQPIPRTTDGKIGGLF